MQVSSGWQEGNEVNWVRFDPALITVEQMAERLDKAGTLIRPLEQKNTEEINSNDHGDPAAETDSMEVRQ